MQNHPILSIKSTAKTPTTASTFKPRVRRLDAGRYLVESESRPGRGHTTTATACSCIGFSYRKTCKHIVLVQAIAPRMDAWYAQATTPAAPVEAPVVVPLSAGVPSGIVRPVMTTPPAVASLDAQTDEAEMRLAHARRALLDTDRRDDSYAVLWRQVDGLEREVAALHYSAMRVA
jgi:hypothetical protein